MPSVSKMRKKLLSELNLKNTLTSLIMVVKDHKVQLWG